MKLFLLLAFAFSLCTGSTLAIAQDDEAREEFRAGIAAVRSDDWEVARGHFERAYELSPRASVLANLAAAQRQTGQLVEAKASYEEWLRDPPRGPLRRRVRAELSQLRPLVPTLNVLVRGAQPRDTLLIDGERVSANEDIEVNPGWREVEVEREGRIVASLRVNIDEGDHEEVQLTVRFVPSALETASLSTGIGETDNSVGFGDGSPSRNAGVDEDEDGSLTWLWVTLGVLVVGAAAGVTAAVLLGQEEPFIGNATPGSAPIR